MTVFSALGQDDDNKSVLDYKLLLPDPTSPSVYMYNTAAVICLSGEFVSITNYFSLVQSTTTFLAIGSMITGRK